MPRKPRPWAPGAIHHAVARGHCGAVLFPTEEDRAFVVSRGARAFRETDAVCLAWAVLNNHYHVLFRCDGPPGPTFARLDSAIAWRVSRRRGERGAVFEDRYFSDMTEDEACLTQRFAYVLGNPLHHRIVPTVDALRTYPGSGLGELLGLRRPEWLDVETSLSMLDPDPARARERILSLLEWKADEWRRDDGPADVDRSPPPGRAVVARPASAAALEASPRTEIRSPESLVPVVCGMTGADFDDVRTGRRNPSATAARSIVAFLACDVLGVAPLDVAPLVGVSRSAIAFARSRGRDRLAELGRTPSDVLARSSA